jgi:hypothetical protein
VSRAVTQHVLALLLVVGLSACDHPVPLAPSAPAIADGQFRQASDLGSGVIPLRLGGTVTLLPGATLQRTRLLRWSSSAPEIAPVTADGLVRGKRIGLATISVEGPSGVERTTVQVQEPPPGPVAAGRDCVQREPAHRSSACAGGDPAVLYSGDMVRRPASFRCSHLFRNRWWCVPNWSVHGRQRGRYLPRGRELCMRQGRYGHRRRAGSSGATGVTANQPQDRVGLGR